MLRFASALLVLLLFCTPSQAAKPKTGDILPDLEVKASPLPAEAAYLGLPAGIKSFRLSQIKAEVLLVEIFSMYCPRCQAGARSVNRVFGRLSAAPQGQKLKMLGLGAGNSAFEVDAFRKMYEIPMPLFQDGDYVLHKALGSVGTPAYLVLKPLSGAKGFQVLFFLEGAFEDEKLFFDQVLRASGVQ
jgi:hypothetical protein